MAIAFEAQRDLAPLTTLHIGGPARYFCQVESVAELEEALLFARSESLRPLVLGGGSNVIISDRGFDGLVIQMKIAPLEAAVHDDRIEYRVGAGYVWDELVQRAVSDGAVGIECLSGIPGSVGATPIQNVGAYGQEVKEVIQRVHCLHAGSFERRSFDNAECEFDYRRSRFKMRPEEEWIVVAVDFVLLRELPCNPRYAELEKAIAARDPEWRDRPAGRAQLEALRDTVLALRRAKGMVLDANDPDARSVGSFFVNPNLSVDGYAALCARCQAQGLPAPPQFPAGDRIKTSAAWLVEQAGFHRGYRSGGVGVSSKHSLALLSAGGGARELMQLASEISVAVNERFGVKLEREPIYVE